MISKEELLNLLEEGLKIEETAIPIYSKHIENTLFLSGFERERAWKIQSTLKELKSDSERHRLMLLSLIKRVQGAAQHVY